MKPFLSIIILLVASGCAAGPTPQKLAAPSAGCDLTTDDLIANRSLSWAEFDLQGKTPTSWRELGKAGCHDAAARAYADYLAFGPIIIGERAQTTARFHLGQSLANAGRTAEAARMIATARRETEVGNLHWNDYVQGTVAFLNRDRAALEQSQVLLAGQPGLSDRINAGVLAALVHCWDKPYLEAAAPACVAASGYQTPAD